MKVDVGIVIQLRTYAIGLRDSGRNGHSRLKKKSAPWGSQSSQPLNCGQSMWSRYISAYEALRGANPPTVELRTRQFLQQFVPGVVAGPFVGLQ